MLPMPNDLRIIDSAYSSSSKPNITDLTVSIPTSIRSPNPGTPPRPAARWRTPEFYVYYLAFLLVVPMMIWVPVSLSQKTHPNYPLYVHRLSDGWIFGRKIDNSDAQYRSFRNNIPSLFILSLAYLTLKRVYLIFSNSSNTQTRMHLIPFSLAFSVAMIIGLHGTSAIKIAFILGINYMISHVGKGARWVPYATWIFNGLMLYSNEMNDGYRFGNLHTSLELLDGWKGIYPRWHISFNITMLRLVSFNMDKYWSYTAPTTPATDTQPLTEKQRTSLAHTEKDYSFVNYVAYVLYAPLYIAGPILTFNDFMSQHKRPLTITSRSTLNYAFRFLTSLLTMELVLHFMYVVAIKDAKAWKGETPFELSMVGFWNLMVVWLKLLLPWRFFRLWALADGIEAPENMVRCMANNYSTLGFWRSWHRSYNLWLIRYIYIPLGGSSNPVLSTLLIFTFVALWHDLSFRLLAWGWLVSLFIMPEILATWALPQKTYGGNWWYTPVCALGGVLNVFLMISANLIGFVIGTDGMMYLLNQITGSWGGWVFLASAAGCVYCGVRVMFEYREEEMRRRIFRRC